MTDSSPRPTEALGERTPAPAPQSALGESGSGGRRPSVESAAPDGEDRRQPDRLIQRETTGPRGRIDLSLQRFGGLPGLGALLQKPRSPSSLLGLSLDGSRLDGVVLRRTNGSLRIQKTFSVALTLNPLTGDPVLVGREIRNHLDQENIRERRCALCVPASLALVWHTKVPNLPEADVASFLQIEAERGFPYGPEALCVATSRCRAANGAEHATLVAIPRAQVTQFEQVFKAAELRLGSVTLAVTSLQSPEQESAPGTLALAIGENHIDLQVTCAGGVVALRSLDGAMESQGAQRRLCADVIARETRITLGQLPEEFHDTVRRVRVFGRGEIVRRFVQELRPRLEAMGLPLQWVRTCPPDAFAAALPSEAAVSPALSLAARQLTGGAASLEFLPPKVSSWEQFTARFSSKKLAWAGAGVGGVALLVAAAFVVQEWQLSRLGSRWAAMGSKVNELQAMQQQIKQFRPWFDESFHSLTILRQLTEAFPEDGAVSAKTVEVRDQALVTCTGSARDTQSFLKMLDRLRAARQIANVKVDQIRGTSPLQFTFDFQWGEGTGE